MITFMENSKFCRGETISMYDFEAIIKVNFGAFESRLAPLKL
jgi:hypothetical protein